MRKNPKKPKFKLKIPFLNLNPNQFSLNYLKFKNNLVRNQFLRNTNKLSMKTSN